MLRSKEASLQVGRNVAPDSPISDHIISQTNSIACKETYCPKKQTDTDSRSSRGQSLSQQHLESELDELISSCKEKTGLTERSTVNSVRPSKQKQRQRARTRAGVLEQEECFTHSQNALQTLRVGSLSSSSNSVQLSNCEVSTGAFRQKTFRETTAL